MHIYLVFGLFPKEIRDEIYNNSKRDIQSAANLLQWNIVKALDAAKESEEITIVNSLYIPSYPRGYKKLLIHTFDFSHTEEAKDYNIGFFNLVLLAQTFKYISLKKFFINIFRKCDEPSIVMIYALTPAFAKLCKYLKKTFPFLQICAVVPDLPQFMDTQSKRKIWYKELLKRKRIRNTYDCIKYIDKFIVLTEAMRYDLNTDNYLVMEGIAPDFKQFGYSNNKKKIILYAGTLNKRYGILDLVEAFKIANSQMENIVLYLFGYGDSTDTIINESKKNKNIKYFGNIPHEELLDYISKADVLINPRKNNELFTKYSFPSKNLEYLSYGIPFVGYRLDGIPSEYYSVMITPKSDSNQDLAETIVETACMNYEKRKEYYIKVRAFIRDHKSIDVQGNRILSFLLSKE